MLSRIGTLSIRSSIKRTSCRLDAWRRLDHRLLLGMSRARSSALPTRVFAGETWKTMSCQRLYKDYGRTVLMFDMSR